jgi:hypothetical protein
MKKKIFSSLSKAALVAAIFLSVFSFTTLKANAEGLGAVSINSVSIAGENVVVKVSASDLPASDDGTFYLFAEKPYQGSPQGAPIASLPISGDPVFSVPLGYQTANCRLYDKFQVAVKQGGSFVAVAGAKYITNPEALAGSSPARKNNGKKGLILDGAKIGNGNTESSQLGVQQGAYNINLTDIIGGDKGVEYGYNGQTYYFDSGYLSQYDHCVKTSTNQGLGMTMVLLNPRAGGKEFMISPTARGGRCNYYLMNTSDDKGLNYLAAVVSFLANRYNGRNGFGQVDNWVIANEVNAKNLWNYSSVSDEMTYAQLYSDSLRVCYNAIKSRNANAYVCISIDQNWTHTHNSSYYSARSMVEAINACISAQGNIDWCVAEHPYNFTLKNANVMAPSNAALVTHSIDTPYLTMENIEQLTDFLSQPAFRNTKGGVRPVLLTEVGYTSSQGEDVQAASIVYAYQRAATNQHIKLITFSRQTDAPAEVKQGLAFGLTRTDGSHKASFEYYQQMNGGNAGAYIQKAAATLGIADWSAAMHAR